MRLRPHRLLTRLGQRSGRRLLAYVLHALFHDYVHVDEAGPYGSSLLAGSIRYLLFADYILNVQQLRKSHHRLQGICGRVHPAKEAAQGSGRGPCANTAHLSH